MIKYSQGEIKIDLVSYGDVSGMDIVDLKDLNEVYKNIHEGSLFDYKKVFNKKIYLQIETVDDEIVTVLLNNISDDKTVLYGTTFSLYNETFLKVFLENDKINIAVME